MSAADDYPAIAKLDRTNYVGVGAAESVDVQARQALAEIDRLRAAVDADFSVITELNARKELTCRWVCNRCGSEVDPRAVRAHVITHAHEEIGLAPASLNQGDPE